MPSKHQDVATSNISPVLFMTVEGEPMSFYLRPGPVKQKLQPPISTGGGLLCSTQQPGVILLIDPDDRGSVPESDAHRYVSIQYIYDCVEKDEQLNLEDYRLKPEAVEKPSLRPSNSNESLPRLSGGRNAYTPEEDTAILNYVTKRKEEIGGNQLWKQMEQERVTSHTWQSMKYRYRARLSKQLEVEEVETSKEETKETEEETKEDDTNQEADVHQPSCEEDAAPLALSESPDPLQTHSAETELTQRDAQLIPTQAENVEAQTSCSPQREVQSVTPAKNTKADTVKAQACNTPPPEEPRHQMKAHPSPMASTVPETDQPQPNGSPQTEDELEESQLFHLEPLPNSSSSSSSKTPKQTDKASLRLDQLQRRSRRQLDMEEKPFSKKLRSSTSGEQLSSSPCSSKKTKLVFLEKVTIADRPPSKRAKGKSAATESEQEESEPASVSKTVQAADEESNSVPQNTGKKKEKRKLGILELATREFEDESESEDEALDPPNPTEPAVTQPPVSTVPPLPPSVTAADVASTQSDPEHGPDLQQQVIEAQVSRSDCVPEASRAAATEPIQSTSKAHLFIFDTESQEEDSQSIIDVNTAAPADRRPITNKDATLSLTQIQLEKDKQQIRELMNQTNQDLVCVTKALLRTSGDFSAAMELLLNPSSSSGAVWTRCDDNLLLSADPVVRQQLQEKYGEEALARRVVFLEVEG